MSDHQAVLDEYRDRREALVAGRIAPHPALIHFGPRLSQENGADVAGWA